MTPERTPEKRREYNQERESAERTQRRRKQIKRTQRKKARVRRQKRRMRLVFALELLCIFGMLSLSFMLGKKAGAGNIRDYQLAIAEQETVYQKTWEGTGEDSLTGQKLDKDASSPDNTLLLVNKENKLPEDYEVELMILEDGVHQAAEEAYKPLCDMLKAGRKEGLVFEICSAYRSVERQQELFDEDVKALMKAGYTYNQAYEEVARETMPPGYSEHATGFAFDIVAKDYQMLDAKQEKTAENIWLREHCAEYGFILRYPKDKEEVTGISYESWHFRYVGEEAAAYIMENYLTLEEYLEILEED